MLDFHCSPDVSLQDLGPGFKWVTDCPREHARAPAPGPSTIEVPRVKLLAEPGRPVSLGSVRRERRQSNEMHDRCSVEQGWAWMFVELPVAKHDNMWACEEAEKCWIGGRRDTGDEDVRLRGGQIHSTTMCQRI